MRAKSSFWGFLSKSPYSEKTQLQRIREEMLRAFTTHCEDESNLELEGSLRFARDLETLWYLRPDLLHAIASSRDQNTANLILRDITTLFKGHLPVAKSSQFGQLK